MSVETTTIAASAGDHVVQFYQHDAQLAEIVARWLRDTTADDVSIVVASQAHRDQFAALVEETDRGDASSRSRVVWLDAAATLEQLIVGEGIDHATFDAVVGSVVRDAAQTGGQVRVYGEMVALLWDAESVLGAIELEGLWNDLANEAPFALLCSYPATIQAGSEQGDALAQICEAHSACYHAWSDDGAAVIDASASDGARASFPSRRSAPDYARRVTTEALRQWGCSPDAAQDARLIVSELVTNAVLHAASRLTLTIRRDEGELLRIAVQDGTPLAAPDAACPFPAQPGHGLGIVDRLCAVWGVEALSDGKIVWAQIRA